MNTAEHLLSCLAEENAEMAQRVSKALRFGLREVQDGQRLNNEERIELEFNDLLGVVELAAELNILNLCVRPELVEAKKAKLRKYMVHAAKQGALSQ